ncbi:MAG: hypothetical protein ACLUFN_02780 [Eubacterium sp.]
MVEYITGIKGIGKTRLLAQAAAATALNSKGNVIYIDCSDKLNLALPSSIRLINTKDYNIESAVEFYGFLVGLCASDYDLTDVFVDSTLEIISNNETDINDFMEIVTKASNATGVNFHFSVCDEYEKELVYQSVSE